MDIKDILSRNLNINTLTGASLKEAIVSRYNILPDSEKRRINREIAYEAIKIVQTHSGVKKHEKTGTWGSLAETNVLGINHASPLDITLYWETSSTGSLNFSGCLVDAGGDQINLSKVLSSFNKKVALVALAGKENGNITTTWEHNFLNDRIIPILIHDEEEDQQVAIVNMVDCRALPGMYEWHNELSKDTVDNINQSALKMLDGMSLGNAGNIWMVLSAGGPVRYNSALDYYASLVTQVKEKYRDKVQFLIDFKFMSDPEEAMSVLDIHRDSPQDIIKPNTEEFLQILISSGLLKPDIPELNTITEKEIKACAVKLMEKYNLLGVLVTMDKNGLMLAMKDRIIREHGIKIPLACHTAAGDSLKAGFVYALSEGKTFEEAVHTGNLFGAGTASMEGSRTVTPEVLAEIGSSARLQNISPEIEYL